MHRGFLSILESVQEGYFEQNSRNTGILFAETHPATQQTAPNIFMTNLDRNSHTIFKNDMHPFPRRTDSFSIVVLNIFQHSF